MCDESLYRVVHGLTWMKLGSLQRKMVHNLAPQKDLFILLVQVQPKGCLTMKKRIINQKAITGMDIIQRALKLMYKIKVARIFAATEIGQTKHNK